MVAVANAWSVTTPVLNATAEVLLNVNEVAVEVLAELEISKAVLD